MLALWGPAPRSGVVDPVKFPITKLGKGKFYKVNVNHTPTCGQGPRLVTVHNLVTLLYHMCICRVFKNFRCWFSTALRWYGHD